NWWRACPEPSLEVRPAPPVSHALGLPPHRHVRDAVLEELRSGRREAEPRVEAGEVRLRVQYARPITQVGQRFEHQPPGQPAAADVTADDDPADPGPSVGLGNDPQV